MSAMALVAALAIVVVAPATAGSGAEKKGVATAPCIDSLTGEEQGEFKYDGITVAWPPNHKERTATITLTDTDAEPAADGVVLTLAGTHDQIAANGEELVGSGNTSPDVTVPATSTGNGSASAQVSFLGERSGTEQDGRVYTFTAGGTTDNGLATCEPVEFTAYVPHDQRK